MAEILNHPYIHPCVSDGGAHVRYLTLGTWPVNFLAMWTRDRQIMSLEKAHYKISGLPAWIAGFTDRGILREGFAADIIVYEQEKLGFQYDSPVYATDFPGGERRLIQKAKGIRYTIVNGVVTFEESRLHGCHARKVAPELRHGQQVTDLPVQADPGRRRVGPWVWVRAMVVLQRQSPTCSAIHPYQEQGDSCHTPHARLPVMVRPHGAVGAGLSTLPPSSRREVV